VAALTLSFGKHTLQVELNDGLAAAQLVSALPLFLDMSRWGEGEYYGTLPATIASAEKRRDVFEIGEVALWPDGNAFCIFFGPTPVSRGREPRMASPGIPLGRIVSRANVLETLGPTLRVKLAAS
jgi:uncharacterized protein